MHESIRQQVVSSHCGKSDEEYKKHYEKNVTLSRLGKITAVHLDQPSKKTIEERMNEVIREELKDEAFFDDCPLCQMTKNKPYDVVYTGEAEP
jgi:hypothetical protein